MYIHTQKNSFLITFKLKGKLSLRSYSFQVERIQKNICVSVGNWNVTRIKDDAKGQWSNNQSLSLINIRRQNVGFIHHKNEWFPQPYILCVSKPYTQIIRFKLYFNLIERNMITLIIVFIMNQTDFNLVLNQNYIIINGIIILSIWLETTKSRFIWKCTNCVSFKDTRNIWAKNVFQEILK